MHLQLNHFKPVLALLAILAHWGSVFEPHLGQQSLSAPAGSQEQTTIGSVATPDVAAAKPTPKRDSQLGSRMVQLDKGAISGNTYINHGLGFSTGFPAGWEMIDLAKAPEILQANHQIAFGDSPEAQLEHESVWRCTRILLWASENPDSRAFLVSVLDPACFPEFQLPASDQDHDAIQRFIERMRRSPFGEGEYALDQGESITTHVVRSHLLIDYSYSLPTGESTVYTSFLMMSLKDVWVFWTLGAPSADGLQELKKMVFDSLKFDAP